MSKSPTASLSGSDKGAGQKPGQAVGLRSGTKLGKYEIVGRLGLGGQALVYKAYDPLLDRFVAIKQISSHLASDDKFMDRFRKEAQILARLGTDAIHVVQIYELVEDERGLFIVMEYVEGQTLDVLIERQNGPMPVKLALEILWNVAVGLRAVHEKGILHRDIKPANILVDVNRKCRITDFGVAARVGGKTSMTLGTTKYMAPELFSGNEVDGRVDIYSLGFIVYEMLAGKAKFDQIFREVVRDERAESLRWMKWHTNREMMPPLLNQINPEVPEVLGKIVAKMTAKNHEQRFASADQVLEVLKRHFTQQGQRAWMAQKRARSATAGAPPAARKPEPIPARAAEPEERRPEPVPERKSDGSPLTTKLPRRKMKRRTRLILLSSIIGVMLLVGLGFMMHDSMKRSDYEAAAGEQYGIAKDLWENKIQYVPLNRVDPDAYNAAYALWRENKPTETYDALMAMQSQVPRADRARQYETLAVLDVWQQNAPSEEGKKFITDLGAMLGPRAKSQRPLQERLAEAKFMLAKVSEKYPESSFARDGVPAREEWLDGRLALLNRDWAKAEEIEAEMRSRRTRADEGKAGYAIPETEIRAYSRELRVEKDFVRMVDEAMALIREGLDKMDDRKFMDAKVLLDQALQIKKSQALDAEYGELIAARDLFEYRRLMALGRQAEANENTAEARKFYEAAMAKKRTNEVVVAIRDLDRREKYVQLVEDAEKAIQAKNASEAARRYEVALKVYPESDLTPTIKQKLAAVKDIDTLPTLIKRLKALDAYGRAVQAYQAGQPSTAIQWIEVVEQHDPNMREAKELRNQIQAKATLADTQKAADQARSRREWQTAISLYRKVITMMRDANGSRSEVDAIQDMIRACEYDWAMADYSDAMKNNDLNQARNKLRLAQSRLPRDDRNRRDMIDRLLASLDTKADYMQRMDAGNKLFGDGKFLQALNEFKTAQKILNTKEVEERIKDSEYSRYLQMGKIDMEQQRWTAAMAWLDTARRYRITPEVDRLRAEAQAHIDGNSPAPVE